VTRAYVVLLAVALGAAVALSAFAHRPRHAAPPSPAQPAAAAPVVAVNLSIDGATVTPDVATVPKGAQVRLVVRNAGATPARFGVAGYESRLRLDPIAPGAAVSAVFAADLPGEDFALLVDGRPAGRFAVTGSHLVEGHR
jgi:hypothetical protein